MKIGFAQADITPPVGCALNGFIARLRRSSGVDTPLTARALWLEEGARRALLISLDLLGLTSETADAATEELSRRLSLPAANILLGCTHTHAGPMTVPMRGLGPADPAYLHDLRARLLQAAEEAAASARSGRAGWAVAPVTLGVNRRQRGPEGVTLGVNPSSPADRQVRVLRLKNEAQSVLLLVHACHPYCLGPGDTLISADFWGHAARALHDARYACLYFNGCSGDIAPLRGFQGWAAAQAEGRRLAEAVLRAAEGVQEAPTNDFAVGSRRLFLAADESPSIEQLRAGVRAPDRTVREEDRADEEVRRRVQSAWADWLRDMESALKLGPLPAVPAKVFAMRLAGGGLVALPGEVFFAAGERIARRIRARPACVAAYAHGYIGYVPTAEAYPEGGYEVEESHRYTGLWRLAPDSALRLEEAAVALWNELEESR